MVEDAKTMSRSVAEQARRRGPPGPHPPRLIPAPGPEAQQQLGGRGPAGQGTARVDLTGRCGEQLRFRSKSWMEEPLCGAVPSLLRPSLCTQ